MLYVLFKYFSIYLRQTFVTMKLLIYLLGYVILVTANDANIGITAYGYHSKFGIPEAERIKSEEESLNNSRIVGGVPAAVGQYPFKVSFSFYIEF